MDPRPRIIVIESNWYHFLSNRWSLNLFYLPECVVNYDTNYVGGNEIWDARTTGVESWLKCSYICLKTTGCEAWKYNSIEKLCYPYDSIVKTKAEQGFVCGPKCPHSGRKQFPVSLWLAEVKRFSIFLYFRPYFYYISYIISTIWEATRGRNK